MAYALELEGRRALVTGGTEGVGKAVIAALIEAGVHVLTTARRTPDSLPDARAASITGTEYIIEGGTVPPT